MGILGIVPHIQIQTVRDNQCARTNSPVCAFPGVKLLFNHFQFHKLFVQSTPQGAGSICPPVSIAKFLPGEFAARHDDGKTFRANHDLQERFAKAPGEQPTVERGIISVSG